jgi:hypothetical protein
MLKEGSNIEYEWQCDYKKHKMFNLALNCYMTFIFFLLFMDKLLNGSFELAYKVGFIFLLAAISILINIRDFNKTYVRHLVLGAHQIMYWKTEEPSVFTKFEKIKLKILLKLKWVEVDQKIAIDNANIETININKKKDQILIGLKTGEKVTFELNGLKDKVKKNMIFETFEDRARSISAGFVLENTGHIGE